MSGVWNLVNHDSQRGSTLANGVKVDDVLARLEAGESLPQVRSTLDLTPAQTIALLGHAALGDVDGKNLGLVQASPRRPWLEASLSESTWKTLLPSATRPARLALAAGLLQIHDFWDASHEAAQLADDTGERAVSAYWHGIAHRREPDSGNAAYWFRRVGRHPIFPTLAATVRPVLTEEGDSSLLDRIVPGGEWNPFAFITFCAEGRPAAPLVPLAQRLQRLEMIALLEATVARLELTVLPS